MFLIPNIHENDYSVKRTNCRHLKFPFSPLAGIIRDLSPIVKTTLPPEQQGIGSGVKVIGFYHGTGKVHHVVQGKDADDYAGHYR